METKSSQLDRQKILSILTHGSIFISAFIISIAIPIGIYFVSEDLVVQENAKEAINFHLNVWLIGAVIALLSLLSFGFVGFIFGPIWFVYHWGLSVLAILHCLKQPEIAYRYPFIFRVM